MKSIRRYLVVLLLSSICLVNFLAALKGYQWGVADGDKIVEQQLVEENDFLAALWRQTPNMVSNYQSRNNFYSIVELPAAEIQSSPSGIQNSPRFGPAELVPGLHWFTFGQERWRILTSLLDENHLLIVGRRDQRYRNAIDQMIVKTLMPIIWVVPLLGLVIWGIVSYGLSPLRRLANLLQLRSHSNLESISTIGNPKELTVVISAINTLMSRLNDAFEREQRFTADAAHELKTPLTAIKLHLHNLQSRIDPGDDSLLAAQQAVDRMACSIEQMLALYRLTPDNFSREQKTVDLADLVKQCVVDLYPNIEHKRQEISLTASPTPVCGQTFALQILIKNIIDNASKYTPNEGTIKVAVAVFGRRVSFIVEDSGPGIPTGYRQRVLDRFYRVGGDRQAHKESGSGLGLSIVQLIAKLHGAELSLAHSEELGGLRVSVEFPAQEEGKKHE